MNTKKSNTQKHLNVREYAKFLELTLELRVFVAPHYLCEFDNYVASLKPITELVNTNKTLTNNRRRKTQTTNEKDKLIEQSKSISNPQILESINLSIARLNNLMEQYEVTIQKLEMRISKLENEIRMMDITLLNKNLEINSLLCLSNQLSKDLAKAKSTMPTKKKDTYHDAQIKKLHINGMSNRAIAKELGISPQTVNNRIKEFFSNSTNSFKSGDAHILHTI